MGYKYFDRVRETTSTTGTGTVTLAGAVAGFASFQSRLAVGDICTYAIVNQTGNEWEVGEGTLATTTTLSRDAVIDSSNAGALVNFSAGTKDVFITISASEMTNIGMTIAFNNGLVTP